jgi:hypothetical protein
MTEVVVHTWSPDDWQVHCDLLLSLHYQFDYQRVPDNVKGDLGIEGFSRDGCLYQCYAAEAGLTRRQLYERQRDKMTVDLGKLIPNAAGIEAMLGGTRIARWVFLVPRLEGREILVHAATKSAEIRAAGLTWIEDDFQVVVSDDGRFAVEKASLGEPSTFRLNVAVSQPDAAELALWEQGQSQLLANLVRKLTVMIDRDAEREILRREIIRYYLQVQGLDANLSTTYTELWLRLNGIRSAIEATLPADVLLHQDTPMAVTNRLVDDYAARIERDCPMLALQSRLIAWGVVSGWLLECPLDFQGAA